MEKPDNFPFSQEELTPPKQSQDYSFLTHSDLEVQTQPHSLPEAKEHSHSKSFQEQNTLIISG